MAVYERRQGVLVAVMGDFWAAFSPQSGETMLLNDESAAVLEILEQGPQDAWAISNMLAADTGQPAEAIDAALGEAWALLQNAGMVRQISLANLRDAPEPTASLTGTACLL